MKTINILHIISKFHGDYPLLDDFILRLEPDRYQSTVIFLRGKPEKPTRIERAGIETIYPEKYLGQSRLIFPRRVLFLKSVIRDRGIDIIHCHRHKPTVYGVISSILAGGKPVISTVHGTGRTRSKKRQFTNRIIFNKTARIIGVSKAVHDDILMTNKWIDKEKVISIPNGLDYSKYLKVSSIPKQKIREEILKGHANSYWFGMVGRLAPKKNHQRLFRVFKNLVIDFPDSILLVAGAGQLEYELKKQIKDLGLEHNIVLLGQRENIPTFLHSLDAFIFPSLNEGLGLALLEAMAVGLPVVAADIGPCQEVVDSTESAILVDPKDEDSILKGLLKLRRLNTEEQSGMGIKARQRVLDAFTIEQMTEQIIRVYDDILLDQSKNRG
ncbi:MAG: glycosyltransferase [Proteobacteria bacterium]|nr:glycosyltransferase [Pseudomonadota bacterium]